MQSPVSPSCKRQEKQEVAQIKQNDQQGVVDLLTPPSASSSSSSPEGDSLAAVKASITAFSPNHHDYYHQAHLSKAQFNSILVNCATNLLKILYSKQQHQQHTCDTKQVKQFIIEILKRSKTSIQSLQLACFYIYKLIIATTNNKNNNLHLPMKCQHLFLGLIIIASKFNQDYNYSFKSWCKIIGLGDEDTTKHVKHLRNVEVQILGLLNYEMGLMGDKYENWCNILFIFGYDFIKYQIIKQNQMDNVVSNDLIWDLDVSSYMIKLDKWRQFFQDLKLDNLNLVKIRFESYFTQQLNQKVFIVLEQQESTKKRCRDDITVSLFDHVKKIKV
ncbi:PCL5 [Candida margitis]|uniref:PCL5 n=1 Tax=Candida margitis TaxID=1775924 RepID=UPI002226B53E|nr:PCL5 [Candida margitis]KAI5967197.1 PCL5 [Candida margitis]